MMKVNSFDDINKNMDWLIKPTAHVISISMNLACDWALGGYQRRVSKVGIKGYVF